MRPLPHRYVVTAVPEAACEVHLAASGVSDLHTAAPSEFDGPGDRWSPETLLVGAVADCVAITFRGVARASQLPWTAMTCAAAGTLDRVEGTLRFTVIDLDVRVTVPEGTSEALVHRVLDKVKRSCLITNSLNAAVRLRTRIEAGTIAADGCRA